MSDLDPAQTEPATEPATEPGAAPGAASAPAAIDLDAIEADLADVELALARLDTGEYWRDEVTGDELDDELLARRPTARRAAR